MSPRKPYQFYKSFWKHTRSRLMELATINLWAWSNWALPCRLKERHNFVITCQFIAKLNYPERWSTKALRVWIIALGYWKFWIRENELLFELIWNLHVTLLLEAPIVLHTIYDSFRVNFADTGWVTSFLEFWEWCRCVVRCLTLLSLRPLEPNHTYLKNGKVKFVA